MTTQTAPELTKIQSRTVGVLAGAQVLSGIAIAGSVAAGSLITAAVSGSEGMAGLAQTAGVVGAALLALPLARIALSRGRRAALATGYGIGAVGAIVVVGARVVGAGSVVTTAVDGVIGVASPPSSSPENASTPISTTSNAMAAPTAASTALRRRAVQCTRTVCGWITAPSDGGVSSTGRGATGRGATGGAADATGSGGSGGVAGCGGATGTRSVGVTGAAGITAVGGAVAGPSGRASGVVASRAAPARAAPLATANEPSGPSLLGASPPPIAAAAVRVSTTRCSWVMPATSATRCTKA